VEAEVVVEEAHLAALLEAEVLPVVVALLAAVAAAEVVEMAAEAVDVAVVAETVAEEGEYSVDIVRLHVFLC
jgi:hypothetical protein